MTKKTFTDQLNRSIEINFPPKRIISLVPSQTELLYDLGLRETVVGVTKFCVRPEIWRHAKQQIGGTKKLKLHVIETLKPDLIIANKEENDQHQIETLAKQYPVWISHVITHEEAFDMILSVGELVNRLDEAVRINIQLIHHRMSYGNLKEKIENRLLTVAYFIWQKPYMVAANHTFIDSTLKNFGFINIFGSRSRYPVITDIELKIANPDIILLPSEPFPFKEKHVQQFQQICPKATVLLVDGEIFSWYGSRMLKMRAYFKALVERLD